MTQSQDCQCDLQPRAESLRETRSTDPEVATGPRPIVPSDVVIRGLQQHAERAAHEGRVQHEEAFLAAIQVIKKFAEGGYYLK